MGFVTRVFSMPSDKVVSLVYDVSPIMEVAIFQLHLSNVESQLLNFRSCVGKGCKRKYHPSCLVPALSNDPPDFWHCIWCVKKKKELGVHSVSEVMTIWDAREVVSDAKAMQSEKQYLVKYLGLAHFHNRWIPEKELLSEAPTLVTEEEEKSSFSELSKLSFGVSPGDYGHYLSYVNKLLAHWHKNQNAVVYDNHVEQHRLIFHSPLSCVAWGNREVDRREKLKRKTNIIVYKGSKDVRSSIRSLEFYNEGGSIMFEILLSASNVVAEDLEMLKCLRWGTIVIDECQRPGMSRYFEQLKSLRTDMKLLLVSGEIKDCSADYQSMLSLLDSGSEPSSDNVMIDSSTDVCKLKERFAHYFAFECKLSSSRLLSSSLKVDRVDAFRELIISFRKCCDHPYLLDQSLEFISTKGLSAEANLDVGIEVSGKLQILDKILLETKARDLRVLILFQSVGGSGRDSVGNILDDFLCQRFGKYSYVRIDGGGYAVSKKKAVVDLFNTKESGEQFLLLEGRTCLSSIKFSAVDVVVLFNSDCKPQNDIKALHRISISSQFEQLKVFRLYSAFTVEEKILILAKNGTSLDSNIQTLSRNSCLKLLSWCASYLFNKLDDFHDCSKSVSVSNVSCEQSSLNAVLLELLTQLPCSGESNHAAKCSFITEVPQNVVYDGNISLFGEKEIGSTNYESSVISLIKLLEGKHPQWKLLPKSSSRNRNKVQYFNYPPWKSELGGGGDVKKSQTVNNIDDPTYPTWKLKGKRNITIVNRKTKLAAASNNTSEKILPCPTDGKRDVNQCWTAANLLKYKLNQNESLALAKQHLNLDCGDEEVEYIYSKLQSVAKSLHNVPRKLYQLLLAVIKVEPYRVHHLMTRSIYPPLRAIYPLSGNQHAFCQEAAVTSHPSLEVPLDESSGAPLMHSVEIPQQPSASRSVPENETCIENQRSTTTLLRSLNELPCQVNPVRPVTLPPACSNPLRIELGRIQKLKEQTLKLREDKILQLKSERDKEIEEIYKKYDMILQDSQMAFKQKEQDFESYCREVNSNHLLAETLIFYQNDEAAGSPVIGSFIDRLIQQSTRIEPSLTSLDAAPVVQMSNHVALASSSAIHVTQSNRPGIRAAAPHLRALNPRSMFTPHLSVPHISFSHGRMLNQLSARDQQINPVFLPHVAPGYPRGVNSYTYVPPLEATAVINNHSY
ncbi:hypothetical protein GQ457_08G020180 [Hibiscus cannabinus]